MSKAAFACPAHQHVQHARQLLFVLPVMKISPCSRECVKLPVQIKTALIVPVIHLSVLNVTLAIRSLMVYAHQIFLAMFKQLTQIQMPIQASNQIIAMSRQIPPQIPTEQKLQQIQHQLHQLLYVKLAQENTIFLQSLPAYNAKIQI
jgi:hypothetical protein